MYAKDRLGIRGPIVIDKSSRPGWATTAVIDIEVVGGGGEADVARSATPVNFDEVATQIEALAKALATPITALYPTKATLEFGCWIGFEPGQLTALLVKGSASANLKVSLEWTTRG